MGQADVIPIVGEKKVAYKGIFDMVEVYNYMKQFIENSLHYDLSEKDYEIAGGSKKSLLAKFEAEQEFNDYYKIKIIFKYFIVSYNYN